MAKQTINVGTVANDRSGDPLRIAFTKINQNFTEVYNNIANTTVGGTDISDFTDTTGLLFSGNYEDLNNRPNIPTDISQLTDNLNVVGNILSETLGDITFSNTSIIGAQSPGSNGLIRLIPNNGNFQGSETGYTTFGQYVDIYPTNQYDAPHIHIAPGKGVGGTGDLVLGDDNFNIQINNQGYATVVTQDPVALAQKYWYFSQNGLLFGPAQDGQLYVHSLEGEQGKNLTIAVTDVLQQQVQIQFSNANGTANTTYTVNTNLWSLADIENSPFCNFYLSPGVSVSPSSITRNGPAEELVFTFAEPVTFNSGTAYYVYYSVSSAPNITLDAANNAWTFGSDGKLTLPVGGDIVNSVGASVLGAGAGTDVYKFQFGTIGTKDNPDTGGWGGYNIVLDPGGESWAGVLIPSVAAQDAGSSLNIYNNKVIGNDISLTLASGIFTFKGTGTLELPHPPNLSFNDPSIKLGGATSVATNNYGFSVPGPAAGVVYNATTLNLASMKLLITIEGLEDGGDGFNHTQVCEMLVVKRVGATSSTVDSVVYGVIHTSLAPLATLTTQQSVDGRVEILAQPTNTTPIYVKVHATEVRRGD